MSRYATVAGPITRSDPIGPFGETLTCPSAPSGALPTKYIDWPAIQVARRSSIVSYSRAIASPWRHHPQRDGVSRPPERYILAAAALEAGGSSALAGAS